MPNLIDISFIYVLYILIIDHYSYIQNDFFSMSRLQSDGSKAMIFMY